MKKKPSSNEIWLVIDSFTLGGIETHVEQLANGLRLHHQSVCVWLVSRYSTPSLFAQRLEAISIPVYYINDSDSSVIDFYRRLQHINPLVVHAHGYKASLLTKIACLLASVPQISTYHAGETPQGRVWWYDWFDRYSAVMSQRSIAVSDKISAKLPITPLRFNNFIDTSDTVLSTGHQIAFVGRMSHEKAPDEFKTLAKNLPRYDFHMYGDGPLMQEIVNNKPSNLRLHGYQKNMVHAWSQIGVLIICSRYEGLPLTALEAMSRGILVIATDVGDLAHLIKDGYNGFLVDNPSQIADKLEYVLNSSHRVQMRWRENAQKTIAHRFSAQSIVPKMINMYLNLRVHNHSQFKKSN